MQMANLKTMIVAKEVTKGSTYFDRKNDDILGQPSSRITKNGRWTLEEKQRFMEAIKIYGKDWKAV